MFSVIMQFKTPYLCYKLLTIINFFAKKKKKEKTARVAVFLCLHEDFTSVFRALSNINVGAFCKIFKLTIFTKTSIVVYDRSLIGPSNI